MRWGLAAATVIVLDVLVFAACDSMERDEAPRFLLPIPPDGDVDGDTDSPVVRPKPDASTADATDDAAEGSEGGTYDPSVLSLTGWWRAPYMNGTWPGNASAGMSAGRMLVEGTTPPSPGVAVNGRLPAAFDGTNDKLANPTPISAFLNPAAWSCVLLVFVDAVSTAATGALLEIMSDTGGYWSIGTWNNPTPKAVISQFDGAQKSAETPMTLGAWNLIQSKFDGTNLRVRVNSGVWVTALSGNIQVTTGTLNVGKNYLGTIFYKGRMLEAITAASALPDATFNDLKTYVNARYALAL